MNPLRLFPVVLAALALTGMTRKPALSIRFHIEASGTEGAPFAVPVKFANPRRDGFMSSVPAISERNIVAVYPVPSPTGSWGCAFRLDESGRVALDTLSREHRGASLVGFVSTKGGTHQLIDMVIDRPVSDGILWLPRGLTPGEIDLLVKTYRTFGPATPAPAKKEPAR